MYCFTGTGLGEWRRNGRNRYCCKKWSHFYSCRSSYPTHHCSNSATSVWWDQKSNCNGKIKPKKYNCCNYSMEHTSKKGENLSVNYSHLVRSTKHNLQTGQNTVLYFSGWNLVYPVQFGSRAQAFTPGNTQVLFLERSLSMRLILHFAVSVAPVGYCWMVFKHIPGPVNSSGTMMKNNCQLSSYKSPEPLDSWAEQHQNLMRKTKSWQQEAITSGSDSKVPAAQCVRKCDKAHLGHCCTWNSLSVAYFEENDLKEK